MKSRLLPLATADVSTNQGTQPTAQPRQYDPDCMRRAQAIPDKPPDDGANTAVDRNPYRLVPIHVALHILRDVKFIALPIELEQINRGVRLEVVPHLSLIVA